MDKVFIAVPCYENIYPDTMKCIWDLGQREEQVELEFDFVRGYSVDNARNKCVHAARAAGARWILFVDNDMTFDPEFLDDLLEWDEPVVMGWYLHRGEDGPGERTNLCKTGQRSYIEQISEEEMMEARDEGYDLVEVKGGGLGFCLIDLSIFDRFGYPWFRFVEYGTGGCLSEDLYFSEQCAANGITVYADTRCYCGHIFRSRFGGNETAHLG